ncbi:MULTISPECIES: GTPase Era [unclassified Fusibacter]|uniref:GTPase Era n=1 Tax=unclassified Fusibacter TaxID=2624464 RepID=UPI0010134CD9|nr:MULTISPECIES: GTPase Era [unclassified Fusibacter]MCK8058110.1 GTPase Era [Fusibacter sp. A2]NPE20692.1 GTPase Era [Fusibacter sp. A1]RXV62898.1 GTPase Era [Fusibacter sp. A1]
MAFKSGFVSIIGRPNVGKSTLLNCIVGEKIAIMTNKPQTTRNTIRAIYHEEEAQVVFMDTPGIHKPKHKLGEYMVNAAKTTFNEVDLVLFMVDDSAKIGPGDQYILDMLQEVKTPVFVVINKLDLLMPEDFEVIYNQYMALPQVTEVYGISALHKSNVDGLMKAVVNTLNEGPMFFPNDMVTDQPERAIVSEIIREKLLLYLEDEIPHGVAVSIESFKERKGKPLVDIQATIICEKKSHKGIIIGKQGRKLKGIGKSSREDIEKLLGTKVYLELWVKIKEGWRNDSSQLKNYGYDSKDL